MSRGIRLLFPVQLVSCYLVTGAINFFLFLLLSLSVPLHLALPFIPPRLTRPPHTQRGSTYWRVNDLSPCVFFPWHRSSVGRLIILSLISVLLSLSLCPLAVSHTPAPGTQSTGQRRKLQLPYLYLKNTQDYYSPRSVSRSNYMNKKGGLNMINDEVLHVWVNLREWKSHTAEKQNANMSANPPSPA